METEITPRGRRRVQALTLAASTLVAACAGPRIDAFSASPRRYCPSSDAVTLSWSVDGRAALSSSPEVDGLGRVPSSGRRKIAPRETTVTLTASKFFADDVRSAQVLSFVKDGETTTMGPESRDVTCDEAAREVVAVVAFEPEEFDPRVRIRSLENAWDRELSVAHRGRAWTVPPGQTVALEPRPGAQPDPGVLAGGPWVLRARLLDDERCGTLSAGRLLHILVNARIGC